MNRQGNTGPRLAWLQIFVVVLAGCAAAVLFWKYSRAVTDGLAWHAASVFRIISPDFIAADPSKAVQVPDFALPDRFGAKVRLSQFAKVDLLVVNIWSSGCPVCREEVPALTELDKRIGSVGKAALLTIAIEEKWEDVAGYFPSGTDLRILFDPDDSVGKGIFGTVKYPETFVLDKQRRIRARFDGERPWHSEQMLDYLGSFI
jgi:thiol-disulfide isomerase/thioredoxin